MVSIFNSILLSSIWLPLATFLLANTPARIWYSLPLIVVVSLVYAATRHERPKEIIGHTIRTLIWVVLFMGLIFIAIWLTGYFI